MRWLSGSSASVVLVRPPDARAEPLVGGRDPACRPRLSVLPDEAAVPRRTLRRARLAVIVDGDRLLRRRALRRDERDEERVAVAPVREPLAVLHHAVDLERHLQVDLHLRRRLEHAIGDPVPAADAAVARADGDVQVVEASRPTRRAPGPLLPRSVSAWVKVRPPALRGRSSRSRRAQRDRGRSASSAHGLRR